MVVKLKVNNSNENLKKKKIGASLAKLNYFILR